MLSSLTVYLHYDWKPGEQCDSGLLVCLRSAHCRGVWGGLFEHRVIPTMRSLKFAIVAADASYLGLPRSPVKER